MNRWCVLAAGVFAATGAAFISGASRPHEDAKPADEKKPAPQKQLHVVAQRTAYFNMPAVMRDFNQAKYKVWLLNNKKAELSKDLLAWRDEYIQMQAGLQPGLPFPQKGEKAKKMLQLVRKIEDEDRKINKQLNGDVNVLMGDFYDKIYCVVEKIAQLNGFQAVLAYPDGVTPEEQNNPHVKQLKLQPLGLQPFEIDPRVEITAIVVKTLNVWYPPIDAKTSQPVDTSKLEPPPSIPTPLPKLPTPGGQLPPPPMPRDLPPLPPLPAPRNP